jgi:hypothetical protein
MNLHCRHCKLCRLCISLLGLRKMRRWNPSQSWQGVKAGGIAGAGGSIRKESIEGLNPKARRYWPC